MLQSIHTKLQVFLNNVVQVYNESLGNRIFNYKLQITNKAIQCRHGSLHMLQQEVYFK